MANYFESLLLKKERKKEKKGLLKFLIMLYLYALHGVSRKIKGTTF